MIESKPKDMKGILILNYIQLSKVYKMKIYSYATVSDEDGTIRHFVGYIEGGELKKKNNSKNCELVKPRNILIRLNLFYLLTSILGYTVYCDIPIHSI